MKNNYVVIMAGGIGSRFWPMSTASYPKQFHDILGTGRTLIQLTVDRYEKVCPKENIFIVTNSQYKSLVKEQLPELKDEQILLEPSRKNTAPCIAYAAYKIHAINPDAKMVVAPSDHIIMKQDAFETTLETALEKASENCLITIGIKPSRPDTGYGYIQFEESDDARGIRKVKTFTEKPNLDLAKRFLDSGDFYWNSGMFVWSAKSIISEFKCHLPELDALFSEGNESYNTDQEADFIGRIYPMCKNISIDYGIMEKADQVFVILADLGWSDLGTWGSLYTHLEQDENRNATIGKGVHTFDCNDNVIMMPEGKTVVLQGLNDYIVVESQGTLLVCKKQDEQKIKQMVNSLKG